MKPIEIKKRILIRRLQLWVHGYIYYELNQNVVSDHTWSKWARELVELQRDYTELSKRVPLYSVFWDFDGSTGMNLPFEIPWIKEKADEVLHRTLDKHLLFLLEGAE